VGLDRSGDGKVDLVRHLDERGEARTVRYDEDSDGRFETEVELEGGRPVKITSGGREIKPGELLHTKGLDSRVAGFARGAQGEMLLRVELRNSGGERLAVAARPSSVEFRLRSATSAGRTFTISAEVPRASEPRLVLEPGESRAIAFPVDFKPPEGAYRLRATLTYGWDESAPTGWMGSSAAEEIDFDGKVGAAR
jgi:hypothetical protein